MPVIQNRSRATQLGDLLSRCAYTRTCTYAHTQNNFLGGFLTCSTAFRSAVYLSQLFSSCEMPYLFCYVGRTVSKVENLGQSQQTCLQPKLDNHSLDSPEVTVDREKLSCHFHTCNVFRSMYKGMCTHNTLKKRIVCSFLISDNNMLRYKGTCQTVTRLVQ